MDRLSIWRRWSAVVEEDPKEWVVAKEANSWRAIGRLPPQSQDPVTQKNPEKVDKVGGNRIRRANDVLDMTSQNEEARWMRTDWQ